VKRGEKMEKLYAGIDVHSKTNYVYLMKPDGSKHSSFNVKNSPDGSQNTADKIISALTSLCLSSAVIGIEATGVYGENMMIYLREEQKLAQFACDFHVLNPKQAEKFKESCSDLSKTDTIDAFVIADSLRFGRITKPMYIDGGYRYKALQTLTRARFFAVQNLTREKQRFANYLFMKCSGLAQEKVFSCQNGATSMSLVDEFETIDEIAYMDIDELADFIKEKGRGKFANPNAVAEAVKAAVKGSYRLPKTVNDSVSQALSVSAANIRTMKEPVKTLEKAIEKQFELIPNSQTLLSVKGFGLVYSAGIIAEIGDINRFPNHAALAKYAGLAWKEHKSGNSAGEITNLVKSGNRYLRYYLLEAADSLRKCDSEFRRFYDLKFKQVNRFQHKRALALTARKLVRLIFRLLKDNRLYTPPELFKR
jgi:transposase